MTDIRLYQGDCLKLMKDISDKSIDMILCDLPYGTTCLKWDANIDFNLLWLEYERVIKDDGVIALFATQPFTTKLISSNLKLYRYSWVWKKDNTTGFLNANYCPLKITEDICIFSKGTIGSLSKTTIRYYPQGVIQIDKIKRNNPNSTWRQNKGYPSATNKLNSNTLFVQKYTGYPTNVIEFSRDADAIHPTQKPVALCEYLIKTYTNNGELVLDNCMGSGTTGVACKKLGRNFIGMEKDKSYFEFAKQRIENTTEKLF